MIFICNHCERVFDDEDMGVYEEPHGEETGVCPYCGSEDIEEALRCELCGEAHLPDELHDGWCDDCIAEYNNDIETCYKVGAYDRRGVELNGLLADLFSANEIEEILFNILVERAKEADVDCSEFINTDKSLFVESVKYLEEQEKKNA